jgi:ribonuclease Z
MELIFLGTGAAVPTARRNTSATALVRHGDIWLFDCGEGTQMQFQKAGLRPGKLSAIFISHFHGDHLYGLIGFLTTLQLSGRAGQLYLFGPEGLADYVCYMKNMSAFEFHYPLKINEVETTCTEKTWDFDDCTITAMPLQHRIFTLGYRLQEKPLPGKFDVEKARDIGVPAGPERAKLQNGETVILKDGRKVYPRDVLGPFRTGRTVTFCLDTMQCDNAVALARDADLLVHEATFDQSRTELALSTWHATARQAAETALKAGAHRLMLTHISARFGVDEEPLLLAEARQVFRETDIACDLMRVAV